MCLLCGSEVGATLAPFLPRFFSFSLFLFVCPRGTLHFGKRLGLWALCVQTRTHTRRLDSAMDDEMKCQERGGWDRRA